jgi:hypothetical protein
LRDGLRLPGALEVQNRLTFSAPTGPALVDHPSNAIFDLGAILGPRVGLWA